MAVPLSLNRKVNHHDGVFLDDTNQQDHANESDDRQLGIEHHQGQQGADTGRRQGAQNRQRMDQTLVQNAEHQVDRDEGRKNQQGLRAERLGEGSGGACKRAAH